MGSCLSFPTIGGPNLLAYSFWQYGIELEGLIAMQLSHFLRKGVSERSS